MFKKRLIQAGTGQLTSLQRSYSTSGSKGRLAGKVALITGGEPELQNAFRFDPQLDKLELGSLWSDAQIRSWVTNVQLCQDVQLFRIFTTLTSGCETKRHPQVAYWRIHAQALESRNRTPCLQQIVHPPRLALTC
jgi:hypothetical protein